MTQTRHVYTKQLQKDGGIKSLFNDLFTAGALEGVTVESSDKREVAGSIGPQLVDKLVNVSTWSYKKKNGTLGQSVKVVNTHKLKDKKEDIAGESSW